MQDFLENLRWRGMLQDCMPGTAAQLKQPTAGYIGFDPTAPSLHIGSLAMLMLLKHFQLAGHQPIVVMGGATGLVGDPSGKSIERPLLDEETIQHNQACIVQQIQHFLGTEQAIPIYNNADWLKDLSILSFLRAAGKHIPVSYILAKDAVKNRLVTGISCTEFLYQLLQAYDFYHLYKTYGVKLQMGGADQWGNITTGAELIRKKGGKAFGLTTPLITQSSGRKFGKTEQDNLWLDPTQTSPYQFYQFWYNCTDEDAASFIKKFTLYDQDTITNLLRQHAAAPHQRVLQQTLAKEVTTRVHTPEACQKAMEATSLLFGKATTQAQLQTLDEATLQAMLVGVPRATLSKAALAQVRSVVELVSKATQGIIFSSAAAARKMIQNRGLRINRILIEDPEQKVDFTLLQDQYLLVQKGKKHHYLICIA